MNLGWLISIMAALVRMTASALNPRRFSMQQTMLRIKDPKITIPFYEDNFGMKLLHRYDFPQWQFSIYFMGLPPPGEAPWPAPGTKESEQRLWTMDWSTLELTHNHGSELDDNFVVNNGNEEPHRGFGHIALMTPDVYASCGQFEQAGLTFQKKPDEGRMKGLAFLKDPQGYWIEIIRRAPDSVVPASTPFSLAQTMIRCKDPVKTLHFYRDLLGMTLLRTSHYPDAKFSLYFLAHLPPGTPHPDPESKEASEFIATMHAQVLEITHNHGTEAKSDEEFSYHNGNDQDKGQIRGFGHLGFLVDELEGSCAWLQEQGVDFKKLPSDGAMRGLAFAYDPDRYWVELIQRGVAF